MKTFTKNLAAKMIRTHEGLKLHPYKCTSGKLTIGYGRNIEDVGISVEEADMLLNNDINRAVDELTLNVHGFESLPYMVRVVLIDMCFNLGITRLMTFKKMLRAILHDDYMEAAKELLDSKYARQVKSRAETLARMLSNVAEIKEEMQ
jgi:lysozyme